MSSQIADIRDPGTVRRIFADSRPEIVFHLAAQSLVRRSYANPLATFGINVLGTARPRRCTRRLQCTPPINRRDHGQSIRESRVGAALSRDRSLRRSSTIQRQQSSREIISVVYQRNLCRDSIAITTARGGNVIGGGDWSEDRIVPDIMRAISAGTPILLRNPDAIRPWQHVLELCEAYRELGARLYRIRQRIRRSLELRAARLRSGNRRRIDQVGFGRLQPPIIQSTYRVRHSTAADTETRYAKAKSASVVASPTWSSCGAGLDCPLV